jgi:trehalose 6-phosphate phosphatase
LFLDFDGTLVKLRSHPSQVRCPARVRRILSRLVQHPKLYVAIVSGRRVRTLRRLLRVKGLQYFGLHGAERGGRRMMLSKRTSARLDHIKRSAAGQLGSFPRVWVEDKGLSLAVHYRHARPSVARAAGRALAKLLKPWRDAFQVARGSRVWEVLPREVPGKSAAVKDALRGLPERIPVVYVGDDGTDEAVFAALTGQITVRVGRGGRTRARYCVRTPDEVLRFLGRLEKELP